MLATTISKLRIVDKFNTKGKFISIYLNNTKRNRKIPSQYKFE